MPVPVAVAPLLRVKVHAPEAVTLPAILVLPPAQMLVFALVIAAVGRLFTVTVSEPVKPAGTAKHWLSNKLNSVKVFVADGETVKLKVPLPVPVVVALLLSFSVHAPTAVTVPVMLVLAPAQMAVLLLVIAAVGRVLTVMVVLPVKPPDTAAQFASVRAVSV